MSLSLIRLRLGGKHRKCRHRVPALFRIRIGLVNRRDPAPAPGFGIAVALRKIPAHHRWMHRAHHRHSTLWWRIHPEYHG